jgi:hypothetical protein
VQQIVYVIVVGKLDVHAVTLDILMCRNVVREYGHDCLTREKELVIILDNYQPLINLNSQD